MGVSCLYFNKKKIWKSLSKLSLVCFFIIFLFYPNPLVWPSQIKNHINLSRVFDPNDPLVQQLNSTDPGFLWDYLSKPEHGNVTPSLFYNSLTDDERLTNMTNFIIDEIIIYEEVMGHYFVLDYLPTVREAISEGRGDCKARTVTMVSFFMYMGYNQVYAVEDTFHTYTCVFLAPNKTDPHYYYARGRTDFMIMFNHEEIIFTKNIFERLGYIFFSERFSKEIREMFQEPTTLFILPTIFVGLGFLLPLIVESPDLKQEEKKYLKNASFSVLIVITGFILAIGIGVLMPQLIIPTIFTSIIVAVHAIHLNFGVKLLKKAQKANKKSLIL